jgi:hypothetical protein
MQTEQLCVAIVARKVKWMEQQKSLEDEQPRIVLLHMAMYLLLQDRQEGKVGGGGVCTYVIHG